MRVNLARTAMWLQDLGLLPDNTWQHLPAEDPVSGVPLVTTPSPFGPRSTCPPPHGSNSPRPLRPSPAASGRIPRPLKQRHSTGHSRVNQTHCAVNDLVKPELWGRAIKNDE